MNLKESKAIDMNQLDEPNSITGFVLVIIRVESASLNKASFMFTPCSEML